MPSEAIFNVGIRRSVPEPDFRSNLNFENANSNFPIIKFWSENCDLLLTYIFLRGK